MFSKPKPKFSSRYRSNNNIESHSIHSSALIWENSFGDENTSVVSTDAKNEKHVFKSICYISRFAFNVSLFGGTSNG